MGGGGGGGEVDSGTIIDTGKKQVFLWGIYISMNPWLLQTSLSLFEGGCASVKNENKKQQQQQKQEQAATDSCCRQS